MSTAEAKERQSRWGLNKLPSEKRRSWIVVVGGILREPMLLLLLAATGIYFVLGDRTEAAALGFSVLIVITISFVQDRRTEHALDALRDLATPHTRVLRDGQWIDLDARELVPDDVIQLTEGDRVPADAVLRTGTPLAIDESLLTGESVPVARMPDPSVSSLGRPGEAGACVFAGTLVGSGNAVAEVLETGARTALGRIGTSLGDIEIARAPLDREVTKVVRRIAAIAIMLCVALAGIQLLSGRDWLTATLAGITLAMSLLPEELPLVLIVFLTLGAWRIARHRVLARRAAAIETLGAVSVLCVDKTGTLTQNRMAIRRIATLSLVHEVTGAALPEDVHQAVEFGLLASSQRSRDPMDAAFATLAQAQLANSEHVHPGWQWLREYPLSQGLLAVTHAWRDLDHARTVVATKGAPEAIIDLCHLDDVTAARWRVLVDAMARDGLRVLGVARGSHTSGAMPANPHDYTFELVGMVGLADPLRDDTAETIATCHRAGIRVIMITGDHPTTARAIARAAGLASDEVLTGADLETLDDQSLIEALARVEVIARAAPAHKLRVIQALRARGDVVGMTGDGVNDATALKAADVGIAMGRGTDVARAAAGLVLLDDALAGLVAAVGVGRTIYDNLRKVSTYLLAVHVPIAGLALLPALFGWPALLGPIHVVLLELVIDPTCSIVFEQEPAERDVMDRPPRDPSGHLFELRRVGRALGLGVAALLGPLAVAGWMPGSPETVRMLAFGSLIAAGIALVIATRGFRVGQRNAALLWMIPLVAGVFALTVAVPWLRHLFGFALATPAVIALAIVAGVAPVLVAGAFWNGRCNAPMHGRSRDRARGRLGLVRREARARRTRSEDLSR